MCNQVAFAVHCRPGDQIMLHELAHPLLYEAGGPAAMVGAVMRPLPGRAASIPPTRSARPSGPPVHYMPRTRALSVEQTANIAGGVCWPLAQIEEVCAAGHAAGLGVPHGRRPADERRGGHGTSAGAFAAPFDSVWLDLTKGLGAPVGAVLAGLPGRSSSEAWVFKQRFGGAMRQAGIIAAAGSTRWSTTSIGWRRTTNGHASWRAARRASRASRWTRSEWRPTS